MIPPGHIVLVISRGDKIIFEDLPCIAVSANEPYVQILAEED